MENEILYSDNNLLVEYSPQHGYMLEIWSGITPSSTYSTLTDIVIGFLQRKNVKNLIIDPMQHKGFGPDSQIYRAQRVNEYARVYGRLQQAIITPLDVFSRFSVDSYSKLFLKTDPVESKFFSRVEEAIEWFMRK